MIIRLFNLISVGVRLLFILKQHLCRRAGLNTTFLSFRGTMGKTKAKKLPRTRASYAVYLLLFLIKTIVGFRATKWERKSAVNLLLAPQEGFAYLIHLEGTSFSYIYTHKSCIYIYIYLLTVVHDTTTTGALFNL